MTRQRTSRVLPALLLVAALAAPGVAYAQEPRPDRASPAGGTELTRADVPASLREWLSGLEPELRRPALQRLRRMPPARRRAFFERWDGMSESERDRAKSRLETHARTRLERSSDRPRGDAARMRDELRAMTPDERQRFIRGAERWRKLSARDRARMRQRLHRFHQLDAARQRELVERAFPHATERERARKLEQLRAARPGGRD